MPGNVPSPRVAGRFAFSEDVRKALSIPGFHAMMVDVKETPPTDFRQAANEGKG